MKLKQIPIILCLLSLTWVGCQLKKLETKVESPKEITSSSLSDSSLFYFPLNVFQDTTYYVDGHLNFSNRWYSKHLLAMNEPILHLDTSNKEVYRFTWLRTFHNPVSIRMEKNENEYLLYWKVCDGAGGYEPGNLTISKKKILDKSEWSSFVDIVNGIHFWKLETNQRLHDIDGSQWILEAKVKDKYHVVDRQSPKEGSEYYNVCNFLIELTSLTIKERAKY